MTEAHFPAIDEVFVDRYRIEGVIGTGGFAQVYRARQVDLDRNVAIKVLKPVTDANKTAQEQSAKFDQVARRFEREARLVSRLKDRHTVMMYDYGRTESGLLYMVLEYIDGSTITELLLLEGALEPSRVVTILRQALRSLHEAHSMDVLHRDIKPGNIMVYDHVGQRDLVKVLDFGIAKAVDQGTGERDHTGSSDVTADGVLIGTPRYMSPEQIRGTRLTPASDIYSLGLVAYELLLGRQAVEADSSMRIVARHLEAAPIVVPLDGSSPARLREIVNRMLLKDQRERFASCEDVLLALETWDEDVALPGVHEITDVGDDDRGAILAPAVAGAPRWLLPASLTLALLIALMLGLQWMSEDRVSGDRTNTSPIVEAAPVAKPPPAVSPQDERVPDDDEPLPSELAALRATDLIASSLTTAQRTAQATAEFTLRRQAEQTKRKTPPRDSGKMKPQEPEKRRFFTID